MLRTVALAALLLALALSEVEGQQVPLKEPPKGLMPDLGRPTKANVLHMGDVFFNGMYPFIDASTGGSIGGMIEGTNFSMKQADAGTKIVPGHGPLGDLKSLTAYRDMLVTVRDRVAKLKKSGQSMKEVLSSQPTKDLDATWGKGFMQPNDFVAIVYNTV